MFSVLKCVLEEEVSVSRKCQSLRGNFFDFPASHRKRTWDVSVKSEQLLALNHSLSP